MEKTERMGLISRGSYLVRFVQTYEPANILAGPCNDSQSWEGGEGDLPEQLARGLRLMSVLEGRPAQVIVAEMLEEHLTKWNPRWGDTVPSRE